MVKILNYMKLSRICLMTMILCSCVGKVDTPSGLVIDEKSAVCLSADDIVSDFMIVPLKGDEPLDEIIGMSCYGDEQFVENLVSDRLYYFRNHEYVNCLHSVGRGPGEYLNINSYSYDPQQKILYVVSDNVRGVLRYSIPSMEYIGTIPGSGQLSAVCVLPSGKLGVIDRSPDLRISYFTCVDPVSLEVDTLMTFDSFRFQDRGFYRSGDAILMGFDWVPSEIVAITQDGPRTLLDYSFGKEGIPLELYEEASKGNFLAAVQVSDAKHYEGKLFGSFQARAEEKGAVTFWYTKNNDEMGRLRFCRVTGNGKISIVKDMSIAGLNIRLKPFAVTEDGYAMIVNGPSDLLIDPDTPMGNLAGKIVKAVDSQKNDNPVVVYFSMKKL